MSNSASGYQQQAPLIIGLAGRIGSGKTTVQDYLSQKYDFYSINFADKLKHIAQELYLPMTRDNLQRLGHGMRQILWDSIWIDQVGHVIDVGNPELNPPGPSPIDVWRPTRWVIGDVRYPNEAEWLVKTRKGVLIFLEAPPQVRYARIQRRGLPRDKQTFDEFMEASKHPTEQVEHLKELAKYVLNADIALSLLYARVDRIMVELGLVQVTTTGTSS